MRFVRAPFFVVIVVAITLAACGDSKRAAGVGGDGFTAPAAVGRRCTTGQKRECSIEIGRDGSVVDCARGEQVCGSDGAWSGCVGIGATFKAVAPPPSKGGPDPDLHTNAVGGSSTSCVDNPCNPYCRTFNDVPDAGITSDPTGGTSSGGTTVPLESSNVPGGFQNKGSLHGQCAGPATSVAYLEACQFDRRCGIRPDGSTGCVPFATGASDGCSALGGGVDITAPVVCSPADGSPYRNLTICNRGSIELRKDVVCMSYPGNSPHYPDANPGGGIVVLDTARTVDPTTARTNPITSSTPLRAGECRTFRVPSDVFQSNGTTSVMCNPPATTVPVTTALFSYALTAETTEFANPDWGRLPGDATASATTTFAHAMVSPTLYATGAINSSGLASVGDLAAAPNGAGAVTALATALSPLSCPSSVSDNRGTWTCSAPTMAADLASSGDGMSLSRSMLTGETASVVATGFSAPGVTGALTGLELSIECANSDPLLATPWVWVQRASDGAWLHASALTPGSSVIDIPLPYGALTAADLSSLRVYLGGIANSFSSAPGPAMSFGYLGLRAKYLTPAYASVDATGLAWAAPPAGTYNGLELTATWRASSASGAVLYVFAKKLDGTTVASATFTPPAGYVAGSWSTSTSLVPAIGLTAADLTAGLRLSLQAHPLGGTMAIDSVGARPSYALGNGSRAMRFRDFGVAIPTGATNLRLTTYASYKIDPALAGDWIAAAAYSVSGSTTTLIGTRSATITGNVFRTYQLGAQAISDPRSIEDPRLVVDLSVGRGPGPAASDRVGSVDFVTVKLEYDAIVATSVAECNPHNNWTVAKSNPPTICAGAAAAYPPWTVSRVFDGACAPGSRPVWRNMGYTSTTPAGTSIEFRFRSFARDATGGCPTLAAVTSGTPAPLAIAQLSPDTQVCSFTAPTATCPVNLESGLGDVAAQNDCLQMDARGVPASSPPASPTLNDWRVTYDCVPRE